MVVNQIGLPWASLYVPWASGLLSGSWFGLCQLYCNRTHWSIGLSSTGPGLSHGVRGPFNIFFWVLLLLIMLNCCLCWLFISLNALVYVKGYLGCIHSRDSLIVFRLIILYILGYIFLIKVQIFSCLLWITVCMFAVALSPIKIWQAVTVNNSTWIEFNTGNPLVGFSHTTPKPSYTIPITSTSTCQTEKDVASYKIHITINIGTCGWVLLLQPRESSTYINWCETWRKEQTTDLDIPTLVQR